MDYAEKIAVIMEKIESMVPYRDDIEFCSNVVDEIIAFIMDKFDQTIVDDEATAVHVQEIFNSKSTFLEEISSQKYPDNVMLAAVLRYILAFRTFKIHPGKYEMPHFKKFSETYARFFLST